MTSLLEWKRGDPVKRVVQRSPAIRHEPPAPPKISGDGITVAVLSPSEGLGGAERQTEALALGLERLGFTVLRGSTKKPPEADVTIWWGAHLPGNVTGKQIYVAHSESCAVPVDVDFTVGVCSGQGDRTIWNGVDPAPFADLHRRPRPAPGEVFTVGWLGRYEAEKNPVLAVEVLAQLPDNFRLVMHGRGSLRGAVYARACELGLQDAVHFGGVVQPERAMAKFDCLLITSDTEGLPLVAVEAMHSGVPVVALNVGDLSQVMKGYGCICDGPSALANGITMGVALNPRISNICTGTRAYAAEHLTADRMAEQYAEVIVDLLRPDLAQEVTAFLIHCGEASAPEALERLHSQTVLCRVEEIAHVAPMDRAFQQMIDRCETPYYAQVDADMLLEPWAVQVLYDNINAYEADIFVGYLWGDVEQQPIQGVKIYRHEATKGHTFDESLSCEWGHQSGLAMKVQALPHHREECYGTHKVLQSRTVAFRRGKRLMQKLRAAPGQMAFFQPLMRDVHARISHGAREPHLLDMYTGMIAGAMGPMPEDKELDAMKTDPDLRRLNWLLGRAQNGPIEATLYLTSKCNHKCSWCRRTVTEERAPDMSMDLIRRVLSVHQTIKAVCLAGFGEPTMHPGFSEVVELLLKAGKKVNMVTNGTTLQRWAKRIAEWDMGVCISLNAWQEENHRRICGAETWGDIQLGVDAMNKERAPFRLSMVCSQSTIRDIPEFLVFAAGCCADGVHLHNVLPHDQPDFEDEVLTVDATEALACLDGLREHEHAGLVKTWPVPIGGPCPRLCESPFVSVGVDGHGYVTPCRRVLPPHERFGSLHRNNWIGEDFAKYRGAMLGDFELPEECRRCFGAWSC
tara:strand:+ start:1103 stop:3667 length:2565 start_codon:yes stop_codon:yes gene_type:complete